jgi:3-methyladenine DNA glycosylase AlkD
MPVDRKVLRIRIEEELRSHVKQDYTAYFEAKGDEDTVYHHLGVPTPAVRRTAASFLRQVKSEGITDIDPVLELCDHLLLAKISEMRTIAFQWSFSYKNHFRPEHFDIFEMWVMTYVTGWGSCDDLCTHSLGHFLYEYPEFIPKVKTWTFSPNPMVRRASAVAFIYSLRREKHMEHIFDVADALLTDHEDLVQKGYGWMLKEATKAYEKEIFNYVMARKAIMPRTALRYAIEKMPKDLRAKALER